MRYVLDASVAVKWVLFEADSDKALRLRDAFNAHVHELLAPDFWPYELANGLTKTERRGVVPPGDAEILLARVMLTPHKLLPGLPLLGRATEISSQARHGFYDCLYVALAEQEGCEFITSDQRLVGKLGPSFPFITSLSSLP